MKKKECVCERCGKIIGLKEDGCNDLMAIRVQEPVMIRRDESDRKSWLGSSESMRQAHCYRVCTDCYGVFETILEAFMYRDEEDKVELAE